MNSKLSKDSNKDKDMGSFLDGMISSADQSVERDFARFEAGKLGIDLDKISDSGEIISDAEEGDKHLSKSEIKEEKKKAAKEAKQKKLDDIQEKIAAAATENLKNNKINIEKLESSDFDKLPLYNLHKTLFKQIPSSQVHELEMRVMGKSEAELLTMYKAEIEALTKDKKRRKRALKAAAADEKIMQMINVGDTSKMKIFSWDTTLSQFSLIILAVIGVLAVLNAPGLISFLLAASITSFGFFAHRRYRKLLKAISNRN